jgi:hypothetical protein
VSWVYQDEAGYEKLWLCRGGRMDQTKSLGALKKLESEQE